MSMPDPKAAAERTFFLITYNPDGQKALGYYCNPDQFCNNPYLATKFHTRRAAEIEAEYLEAIDFPKGMKVEELTWFFQETERK